jgi:hypothetical protein
MFVLMLCKQCSTLAVDRSIDRSIGVWPYDCLGYWTTGPCLSSPTPGVCARKESTSAIWPFGVQFTKGRTSFMYVALFLRVLGTFSSPQFTVVCNNVATPWANRLFHSRWHPLTTTPSFLPCLTNSIGQVLERLSARLPVCSLTACCSATTSPDLPIVVAHLSRLKSSLSFHH